MSVNDILQYAFEKFDAGEYDEALLAFMAAHQASTDTQEKEDIFQVVNENYIQPNEDEFRNAYAENCDLLKNSGRFHFESIPEYDSLSFKMVPVSDSKFYVWNNDAHRFEGKTPVIIQDIVFEDEKKEFSPILIEGYSDLRLILSEYEKTEYSRLYLVYKSRDLLIQFCSFLTVPHIGEMLEKICVDIFDSDSSLESFFYDSGAYTPRHLKYSSDNNYARMFSGIHLARVGEKRKGNNIYLSICIPSWNRGKESLDAVSSLRKLLYDEEIEIVICNNGSTKEIEYYKQIAEMAEHDKRIVYKELPSKCYRDSFENVVSIPRGKYALFCTDQDRMILDYFEIALNYIFRHENMGVITFKAVSSDGSVYYERDESIIYEDGYAKVFHACGSNYLSGLCFNMTMFREKNLSEVLYKKFHNDKENVFYLNYTHCVYAAYLVVDSAMAFSNVMLFKEGSGDRKDYGEDGGFIYQYIFPENRVKNFISEFELLLELNMEPVDLVQCILNSFNDVYRLLRIGYGYHMDVMKERHDWKETCEIVYEAQKNIMKDERLLTQIGRDYYPKKMHEFIDGWYADQISREPVTIEEYRRQLQQEKMHEDGQHQ